MTIETQASLPLGNQKSSVSSAAGLLFAGFILTGIVTTLLGPILPYLAARSSLDDSHSGLFFTAQFAGSMTGVLLSSSLLSRRGPRASLMIGYATMGIGVAALAINSWTLGMLAVGCFGFGLGLVIPITNLLIAESNPDRRAASLSTLNMCWGLGAVIWPVLASGVLKFVLVPATFLALGAGALTICIVLAWTQDAFPSPQSNQNLASRESNLRAYELAHVALIGLLFFLYVGTENSLGGWVASLARRAHLNASLDWAVLPSFFWGGLLVGRAVAPLVLKAFHEIPLARGCLLLALSGTVVILTARSSTWFVAGVTLSGLGLSCIFPITVSQFSLRLGRSATRFLSAMFALASLGGATLPWLVGFVSTRSGSLKTGIGVPAAACFAMLVVYLVRFESKHAQHM